MISDLELKRKLVSEFKSIIDKREISKTIISRETQIPLFIIDEILDPNTPNGNINHINKVATFLGKTLKISLK